MPEPDEAAAPLSLRAERLIRLAARRSNLLVAGAPALVLGDHALAAALRERLAGFGALPGDLASPRFVFALGAEPAARTAERLAALAVPEPTPPPVVVLPPEECRASVQALLASGWAQTEARPGVLLLSRGPVRVALVPDAPLPAEARAASGAARIAWARLFMPVTRGLAAELGSSGLLAGRRIGVSLVLEPKTCVLALALAEAGAEVAVFAPENETDRDAAVALRDAGIPVFAATEAEDAAHAPAAPAAEPGARDAARAAALLDWGPELLIDDGSHLIRLAHTEQPGAFARLRGAAEETTSGVRPLVELAADGGLRVPVIGVNNARTKTLFDNLVGTGQSCVLAIADLLDPEGERPRATPVPAAGVAGQRWLVIGYGPVGAGTARHARALGARVTVHDTDPVRALSAQHDGFPSTALMPGIAGSDVVVSATGVWHTVGLDALAAARPGTVFAVAGGIDDELALDDAARAAWISDRVRPGVRRWRAPGEAAEVLVLADGGGVNYTAGEGNPVEIMDLSFGTQLAALRQLVDTAPEPGLVPLRAEAEAEVARIALRGSPGEPPASPERPDTAPAVRPGGAAQHWSVHRYRSTAAENLEE